MFTLLIIPVKQLGVFGFCPLTVEQHGMKVEENRNDALGDDSNVHGLILCCGKVTGVISATRVEKKK